MRFAWTVAGDDPDYAKVARHGLNGFFAPLWDSLTTTEYLLELRKHVPIVGVYYGHNWHPGKSPSQIAQMVHTEVRRLNVPKLRVQFNWEQHDPAGIAAGLETWRSLEPKRDTSWNLEGMQGGWATHAPFVDRVLKCRVRVVPQAFFGDMERIEGDQVLRDLTRGGDGFPEAGISICYDGAQVGALWDGYAFTVGRLS